MNTEHTPTPWIVRTSAAYEHGYEQGLIGEDAFHNPCEGNAMGTRDHYAGFVAGAAYARTARQS